MNYKTRSQNCIAQGALTNSKNPKMLIDGAFPTHIISAHGTRVKDESGNSYIDFMGGLGTNFFGYGNTQISGAIQRAATIGGSHSLPTRYEVEAAEKLKEIFYFVERFKFLKTGSEACSAAIKIARAATGRDLVLSDAYHGWHDDFTHFVPPAKGVPSRSFSAPLESLNQIDSSVAAVIVEPVITDYSRDRIEYLKDLRKACDKAGAILIFDEVITGFRFKKYSVAHYTNITPDLICLGKAIGGGAPLAAVGGKADIMDDMSYFVSSTYAGDTLGLAGCIAACDLLMQNPQYNVNDLWIKGQKFIDHFNTLGNVKIEGYPTRGVLKADDPGDVNLFMQEAALSYMIFCKSWFYNFEMPKEEPNVWLGIEKIQTDIKNGKVKMKFPEPMNPFAQNLRSKDVGQNRSEKPNRSGRTRRKSAGRRDAKSKVVSS